MERKKRKMGIKSRSAYAVEACIGPCANRGKKCSECIGKNKFVKIVPKGIDDAGQVV